MKSAHIPAVLRGAKCRRCHDKGRVIVTPHLHTLYDYPFAFRMHVRALRCTVCNSDPWWWDQEQEMAERALTLSMFGLNVPIRILTYRTRRTMGLTMQQIAEKMNITVATWQAAELGEDEQKLPPHFVAKLEMVYVEHVRVYIAELSSRNAQLRILRLQSQSTVSDFY